MNDQNQQFQGPGFQATPNPQNRPQQQSDYIPTYNESNYGHDPFAQHGQPNQQMMPQQQTWVPQPQQMSSSDRTLRLIAFIINLATILFIAYTALNSSSEMGLMLAWIIPMTVISGGIYKGTKKNTTGFGVATLLFVNVISGILLLMSEKDRK